LIFLRCRLGGAGHGCSNGNGNQTHNYTHGSSLSVAAVETAGRRP
jgi:hypothetical protein